MHRRVVLLHSLIVAFTQQFAGGVKERRSHGHSTFFETLLVRAACATLMEVLMGDTGILQDLAQVPNPTTARWWFWSFKL